MCQISRVSVFTLIIVLSLLLVSAGRSDAQTSGEQNLRTCLSGRYPALCNHAALSAEQLRQVREAENRENLRMCITGNYPALCDHSRLTPEQAKSVQESERVANLRLCMTGRYPALCNHKVLSSSELAQVRAAEHSENLRVCMEGRYSAICNHSLLSADEAKSVASAEARAAASRPVQPPAGARRSQPGTCDTGLSIASVAGDGKVITLNDGSLWEVDDVDTIDTALWLPASDVVVCNGKMINTDDNESADVTPIGDHASSGTNSSGSNYEIQASANDETFVINGEVFKAKTYCFNFDKGDRVLFLEGSPFGACASAKLLNLRTKKICEVWCE